MTAFDKAWGIVKELSDYERATAKEFASGDMKEGYIDREIRDSAGPLSSDEFHDIWARGDSCGCNIDPNEYEGLVEEYRRKNGFESHSDAEAAAQEEGERWVGYNSDLKWMKHGPNYLPNRNSIHASCGHCGTSTLYNLDEKEFRHT